jgi:capsular exopolysaccharide synthesis family protein
MVVGFLGSAEKTDKRHLQGCTVMELTQFIQLFWRWLWLIVLCTILAAGAAYLFTPRQPPVYVAGTTLLVTTERSSRDGPTAAELSLNARMAVTYKELLDKRPILEQVVANLGLATSAGNLRARTSVELIPDTNLLLLRVSDTDPQRAAVTANEIVRVFNQQESALLANPFAGEQPALHVVEPAIAPEPMLGSGPLRIILTGAIAGALLAAGLAFLFEYTDTSLRSREAIAALTEVPAIATIGKLPGRKPHEQLIALRQPEAVAAETYRMIRGTIDFAAQDRDLQVLLVTSSRPLEGKSVTAANLAVGLAQTGMRVVLIDANLRRPALHEIFQQSNQTGLTSALQQLGETPVRKLLHPTSVEHLWLLPAGPAVANPARLLVPQRMQRLIAELDGIADIVLFDSPSLLDVIDTTLLLGAVDAGLLVVQAGQTLARSLLEAKTYLERSRTHLLGVVLNQAPSAQVSRRNPYGNRRTIRALPTEESTSRTEPISARPTQAHPHTGESLEVIPLILQERGVGDKPQRREV